MLLLRFWGYFSINFDEILLYTSYWEVDSSLDLTYALENDLSEWTIKTTFIKITNYKEKSTVQHYIEKRTTLETTHALSFTEVNFRGKCSLMFNSK